jgi:putative oxidoreductase
VTSSALRVYAPKACGAFISLVFLAAALPKLIDPGSFAADIQNYRVLPETLVGHAALYVPAFELVVALGLLWSRYQRGAALIATCMLLMFAAAMAQARTRGIDLSCGCFGAAFESKVSWWTVARSTALAVIAAVPWLWPARLATPRVKTTGASETSTHVA